MNLSNCNFRCSCIVTAIAASIILGVIAAFLQITAVITVTPVFLWIAFGIAIAYLGLLLVTAALADRTAQYRCLCAAVSTLLTGILGTILFSAILLAVGITATSVVSAILVGLFVLFFTLTVTSSACFVKHLIGCNEE